MPQSSRLSTALLPILLVCTLLDFVDVLMPIYACRQGPREPHRAVALFIDAPEVRVVANLYLIVHAEHFKISRHMNLTSYADKIEAAALGVRVTILLFLGPC